MATFRKIKSGWQAQVRKKGHPSITKSFRQKSSAEQWAKETEIMIERGIFQDPSLIQNTQLKELLIRYRDTITPTKKGARSEHARLNYFLTQPISEQSLISINGQTIAEWRDCRLQEVSSSTTRRELTILSHVFEVAIKEWNYPLLGNPVKMIRRPIDSSPRERRLKSDEEQRLLEKCKSYRSPWLYPLVVFAIETGMRRGEILSLDWDRVDLPMRTASLSDTKNGDARTVPLSTKAVTTLKSLPRSIDGRVFPLKANAVNLAWQRIRKRAGLGDLRFHDLRHETVSRLFEKGLNPIEVSSISGHKTLQMLKRYTHLRAEDLAKKLG